MDNAVLLDAMKSNNKFAVGKLAVVLAGLGFVFTTRQAIATPISLGTAGPDNYAVLEIGNGNVSLANAANAGHINGNVGVAGTGNISDGGSLPITGNVQLGTLAGSSGLAGNVSGSVIQNAGSQAALNQASADATAASAALKLMTSSGGGVGITSVSTGGTLSSGVYNLTGLQLNNGAKLILNGGASDIFIFNISGALSLNSAQILLSGGLTSADVIFNITGSQAVQFSGGLNDPHGEAELNGIILAPTAAIQITPGAVNGEIISGQNINIASGGDVNDMVTVPDAGSTLLLASMSLGALGMVRRKMVS
ncbi:hypothetical protein Cflav_PD0035 [Pedosphaera parvula Ellin514]|uniref:VPDSG-CTERM protein sorting domain-containing protein n=2 Tax=Pedosphaera TaxID=1032526 RepID=B9XT39_PEDPL|nr:hypothetical protein Cflav_PD0035 [Pedosphaera parvula Ellin514]